MRKKIIAGNWKMNNTLEEGLALLDSILNLETDGITDDVLKIIATPSIHLIAAGARVRGRADFAIAAQNCHQEARGAFTGEISAEMIASTHARFVIVGHSERRQYFNETNEQLAQKIDQVLTHGMIPIYCVGESSAERKANNHFNVVQTQLKQALFHLTEVDIKRVIVAYEPVWAIGTGDTATAEQAQEMHLFIRTVLDTEYGKSIADTLSILYGGSCNVSNAAELFACADIDGGLIGGASLKATDFVTIANSFK